VNNVGPCGLDWQSVTTYAAEAPQDIPTANLQKFRGFHPYGNIFRWNFRGTGLFVENGVGQAWAVVRLWQGRQGCGTSPNIPLLCRGIFVILQAS